jgi:hypothetical protein
MITTGIRGYPLIEISMVAPTNKRLMEIIVNVIIVIQEVFEGKRCHRLVDCRNAGWSQTSPDTLAKDQRPQHRECAMKIWLANHHHEEKTSRLIFIDWKMQLRRLSMLRFTLYVGRLPLAAPGTV